MGLERSKAKKDGIVERDSDDPEFEDTLQTAHNLQLQITREKNRHEQAMKETDMGILGKFFGDGKNTQTFVALISVIFGLIIYVACLYAAKSDKSSATFWSESGSKALAFAGTALGYIFGRATTSSRR